MNKADAVGDGSVPARSVSVAGPPEVGMFIIFGIVALYSYTLMLVYLLS